MYHEDDIERHWWEQLYLTQRKTSKLLMLYKAMGRNDKGSPRNEYAQAYLNRRMAQAQVRKAFNDLRISPAKRPRGSSQGSKDSKESQ
jgi:hypothetical protein